MANGESSLNFSVGNNFAFTLVSDRVIFNLIKAALSCWVNLTKNAFKSHFRIMGKK